MSLVGNLEDLGLGDILQIVSLSRKSGVLYLRAEPGPDGRRDEGEIIFQNGHVIRATSTAASQNLGDLLLARRIVTEQQLDAALALQRAGGNRERIGNILVKHLNVPAEKIQETIRKQTEAIVYVFFRWARGNFSFELKEADGALDKVDIEMRHLVLDTGLNPQFLAMEGTRLKDEIRGGRPLDPSVLPVPPKAAADDTPVEVTVEVAGTNGHAAASQEGAAEQSDPFADLSVDASELAEPPSAPRIAAPAKATPAQPVATRSSPARAEAGAPHSSAQPVGPSPSPARAETRGPHGSAQPAAPPPSPARAEAGAPHSSAEPVGPSPSPARAEAGAPHSSAQPVGPSPSPARTETSGPHSSARAETGAPHSSARVGGRRSSPGPIVDLSQELGFSKGQAALGGQSSRGLAMLKAMISELTSPEAHGQITLLILRFASELMRRAVLFLVKEDEVVGLGQFGIELPDGENPDSVVRGIKVPLAEPSIFTEVLKHRAAVKVALGDGRWDRYLVDKLGGPRPAEVFCAPISSGATIAAVLYADNAPEETPIGDTEALEIFLHQAGLQMEKALLERKIRELNRPGR